MKCPNCKEEIKDVHKKVCDLCGYDLQAFKRGVVGIEYLYLLKENGRLKYENNLLKSWLGFALQLQDVYMMSETLKNSEKKGEELGKEVITTLLTLTLMDSQPKLKKWSSNKEVNDYIESLLEKYMKRLGVNEK